MITKVIVNLILIDCFYEFLGGFDSDNFI